jgi:hypothetical protein
MNTELSFAAQPARGAKSGVPPVENIRLESGVSTSEAKAIITKQQKGGKRLLSLSVWGAEGDNDEQFVRSAVAFAEAIGIVSPKHRVEVVPCTNKRTGEMFTRERLRIRAGFVFGK